MPQSLKSKIRQAMLHQQQGQIGEAERLYTNILLIQHDHFEALHLLGVLMHRKGRSEEACKLIARALETNAQSVDAHVDRGRVLTALKRHDEALASYDAALAVKPNHFDALILRGNTLYVLARNDEALSSYSRALALKPNHAVTLNNRGSILLALNRCDEALESYDRALAVNPDYADAHSNRGCALEKLDRPDEALVSYDRALALRPDNADALYNRGNVLRKLHRYSEALASYDRAIALRPSHADAHNNRGQALRELMQFDQALASYDRALALQPQNIMAHCNAASLRLMTGDFNRGWAHYEWRWLKQSVAASARHAFPQPRWLGGDEIAGKTILLHSEQGLGDTIQFCRYAPLVAARGAKVILEIQKPLASLMANLAGVEQVVVQGDPLPDFDLHCPLLSLPLAFGTQLETIPSANSYLSAPAQRMSDWQARLGPRRRTRIGLAWSGNAGHERDQERSIQLSALQPLLDVDATFVSLQKDVRPDDMALLRARGDILHFGDELGDFSDTAALTSQLDLVISVDTSVAHLAGALGKPAWILLTYVPDFRWLLDWDDSPWYPTIRLFRQDATRAWDGVVRHVHEAAAKLVDGQSRLSARQLRQGSYFQ
jgi:tetratricopeptide (TPR) repeat protein